MAVDYLVVNYDAGQPADALAAFLNGYGAGGWRLQQVYALQHSKRRGIFAAMGVTEYLIADYDAGLPSDELSSVLDVYGADGWSIAHVDMLQYAKRRAIFVRISVTEKQSFVYRFNTSNAPPVPSGDVMIDNDDPSLASYVYVANLTDSGTDVSVYLKTLLINDRIYIQDQANGDNYYLFHLIAPAEPAAGYVAFPVAFDERGIADLANNAIVAVVMGTNVTISGGGGGGIPEAPMDSVTYGRMNGTWNPAIAHDNDVMDGGNF